MDINLNNELEDTEKESSFVIEERKPKESKRFVPHSLITLLIILVLSIVTVGSYVPIRGIYMPHNSHVENYLKSGNFTHTLGRLTNYLYHAKILEEDLYDPQYENIQSVKYIIKNRDSNTVFSNIENLDDTELQQDIVKSLQHLTVTFDENGNVDINSTVPISKQSLIHGLQSSNDEDLSKYSNLTLVYFVPEDFTHYRDFFTYSMKDYHIEDYIMLILVIGGISTLLLLIMAFAMPYEFQRKKNICKFYNKLYFEVKALIWLAYFLGTALVFNIISSYSPQYGYRFFNLGEIIYDANETFYIIGIALTFVLYLLIYLSVVDIKNVYYKGLKTTFVNNSITGKICSRITRFIYNTIMKVKKFIHRLIDIDITKDPNRTVFLVLILHLFILGIIALVGGFTIIFALAYCIFSFKYFTNYMTNIKEIHDVSCQLAEGEFNISLNEDIGMLRPIAENLNNIKEGFQLAVDKEIKSQRMKAELISNVSHDLKTPLTSIITYVDLLKDNTISEKTRAEYIGILDKKSKRLNILIEDLFEASKVSSGNMELVLERIDVIALFRQTLGELEERIKESSLIIKTNLPENKVMCNLDGKRTYRVFENIMSNIFKYAMENSRVYIDVTETPEVVVFSFKNISAYEMNFDSKDITDRFVRGDQSRSTEGSGLGLSIAKSFVEVQKGTLEISTDGDLFKLIITFPKDK